MFGHGRRLKQGCLKSVGFVRETGGVGSRVKHITLGLVEKSKGCDTLAKRVGSSRLILKLFVPNKLEAEGH